MPGRAVRAEESSRRRTVLPALLAALLVPLLGAGGQGPQTPPPPRPENLAHDLFADGAAASRQAERQLAAMGDRAVPVLAGHAASGGALVGRLTAVELLGRIATPGAINSLIDLLRREKHLAVRGQICMQLGRSEQPEAVPVIAAWLEQNITKRSLADVPGPKECQPSTCYIRHVEALAMIGDDRAIDVLEAFAKRVPGGVGYGGFVSNFVSGAVAEALEDLRDRQAFRQAVRRVPGLEQEIAPLLKYFREDALARFRLHRDEVVRGTAEGKRVLEHLAAHADAATARAARELLGVYDRLERQVRR